MKLKLPSGTTGFWNEKNEWQCTGSQMGRRDELPDDRAINVKLHLSQLRWVDGGYDQGGAYWGYVPGQHIYVAHGDGPEFQIRVYVKCYDRIYAKNQIRKLLPNARFYR